MDSLLVTPSPLSHPPACSPEEIQEWFSEAINGPGCDVGGRMYKINSPPSHRPIRISADGVNDLFHYGHALQLRQAKLAFASRQEGPDRVYVLAGVHSDEVCAAYKNETVMTHQERCEAVLHCRWVDEVVQNAPWIIDADFLAKHNIDYVAHDVDPYGSAGHDDVYAFCKISGKFLPTRRTPGISTSDIIARIVTKYRGGTLPLSGPLVKVLARQ